MLKKKILSVLTAGALILGVEYCIPKVEHHGLTVPLLADATSAEMERAISWAINIADDNSHGYCQAHRTGPDYDCSSLVAYALRNAGIYNGEIFTTSTMPSILPKNNFTYIKGTANLQRGDILWRSGHTEIYIGNNQTVGAHDYRGSFVKNPDGSIKTTNVGTAQKPVYLKWGIPGDQDGTEINIAPYTQSWTGYFRYNGGTPNKLWYEDLNPENVGDEFCALVSNAYTDGYMQNDGWNVAAYAGDLSQKQAWIFRRQADNSYIITSLLDTNRLTVYNHENSNCSSLIVTTDEIDEYQRWFIYKINGNYVFRPSHSDRVMDLNGGGFAAGTNLQLYDYNESTAQTFKITKTDWTKHIVADNPGADFTAKILNATTNTYWQNEGWNVGAHSKSNNSDQIWWCKRQSALDGARLTAYEHGIDNNVRIIVTLDKFDEYQKWWVYYTNSGYVLRPAYCGKVADIEGGSKESGANIQLYTFNSTYAQFFKFEKAQSVYSVALDANGGKCSDTSMSLIFGSTFGDLPTPTRTNYTFKGWFTAKTGGTQITSATVIDTPSLKTLHAQWLIKPSSLTPEDMGSRFKAKICNKTTEGYLQNEGWNVAAYAGTFETDQMWTFDRQSDGSYVITSSLDNNRLTVYNQEDADCSSVIISSDPIDKYQKWFIYKTDKGYILRPSYSERVMDLKGGKYDAGTDIQLYTFSDGGNQYFNIIQEKTIVGDCNGDGEFSIADAVALQKWILAVPGAELADWQAADLCENGTIDVLDLCMMKHMLINQ